MKAPLFCLLCLCCAVAAEPPVFPPGATIEQKKAIIKSHLAEQQRQQMLQQDTARAEAKVQYDAKRSAEVKALIGENSMEYADKRATVAMVATSPFSMEGKVFKLVLPGGSNLKAEEVSAGVYSLQLSSFENGYQTLTATVQAAHLSQLMASQTVFAFVKDAKRGTVEIVGNRREHGLPAWGEAEDRRGY